MRSLILFSVCCSVGVMGTLWAGDDGGAEQSMTRYEMQAQELEMLTEVADELFEDERWQAAADGYEGALSGMERMAPTPFLEQQREQIEDRLLQAQLHVVQEWGVGGGDQAAAQDLLISLAADERFAGDVRIEETLDWLNERMSPVNTPEHRAEVAELRELLWRANEYLDAGRLDLAEDTFEEVLLVDPYNQAARRGMEEVENARLQYQDAAYSQTRSTLIRQVDESWELAPSPTAENRVELDRVDGGAVRGGVGELQRFLNTERLERFELNDTLDGALNYLRRVLARDYPEVSANFVVMDKGAGEAFEGSEKLSERRFDLNLQNVSFANLLDFIATQVNASWTIERNAVVFESLGSSGVRLYSETYSVPPSMFLDMSVSSSTGSQDSGNPFASASLGSGGGSAAAASGRQTPQQILANMGILFDGSASASYSSGASMLTMNNTAEQHEILQRTIEDYRRNGDRSVKVTMQLIVVNEINTEDLGFDTLIAAANIPGSDRVFLSGGTPAGGASDTSAPRGYPFVLPGTDSPVGGSPLSSGLRSGREAFGQGTLGQAINGSFGLTDGGGGFESPGIASIAGVFTDPQWQIVMRGLSQSQSNDFVTSPEVVVQDGRQVVLVQQREIFVPRDYDPPELPNQVGGGGNNGGLQTTPITPANPTDFEQDAEGMTFEVLPQVGGAGDSVNLDIAAEYRVFEGFINYGSPISTPNPITGGRVVIAENRILQPVFRNYDLSTQVVIYDHETMVVGGLLTENVISYEDKIPLLGDIPILGRLFQSQGTERVRSAIFFAVSVEILDPYGLPINERRADMTQR